MEGKGVLVGSAVWSPARAGNHEACGHVDNSNALRLAALVADTHPALTDGDPVSRARGLTHIDRCGNCGAWTWRNRCTPCRILESRKPNAD